MKDRNIFSICLLPSLQFYIHRHNQHSAMEASMKPVKMEFTEEMEQDYSVDKKLEASEVKSETKEVLSQSIITVKLLICAGV